MSWKTTSREFSNHDDTVDSRDLEARRSELEDERTALVDELLDRLDELTDTLTSEESVFDRPARLELLSAEVATAAGAWERWWGGKLGSPHDKTVSSEDADEWVALEALKAEAEGYCDWDGGAQLIRDSFFESYARELAEELHGKALRDAQWPFDCIDWKDAAQALQQDYTMVTWDGVDYWVRE